MSVYSQYRDPQVRALVWSLLSPGLVNPTQQYAACVRDTWCQDVYRTIQASLSALDNNPEELKVWLAQFQSWRLGIRFEAYWGFILYLLKKHHKLLACAEHIQVQDKSGAVNKTLGEMDFVYQDENRQLHHLELAAKFYLLKPDEFGFERLLGPNGGDWYERKLEHLFKKQLLLSTTAEAQSLLAERFSSTQLHCQQHGLIKGMIFFPLISDAGLNENEKTIISSHCLTGTWGTINTWYLSDPGEIGRWIMLQKLDWLVPQVFSIIDEQLYTAKEMSYKLKSHFHNSKRSVLLARLEYDQEQQLWLEQQRVMVVDKYWPEYKRSLDNMLQQAEQRAKIEIKQDNNEQ